MKDIDHYQTDDVTLTIAGCLSLIGTSTILVTFFRINPTIRNNHWLLFWLSTSDFLTCLSFILSGYVALSGLETKPDSWECYFQGAFVHATNVATFCWAGCIVVKILLEFYGFEKWKYEMLVFHSICWGFPLIQVLIITLLHQWGNGGAGWCWIYGSRNPSRLFFYGPLVAVIIFSIISISYVLHKIQKLEGSTEIHQSRRLIQSLAMYPMVLTLCWTGAIVNRLQNAIDPDHPIRALFIWEYTCNALQGILNACVFGFTIWKFNRTPDYRTGFGSVNSELRRLIDNEL